MHKPRSAIIVALPIPRPIESIRRTHVPVARLGVPPHVTILSPFLPAVDLDAAVRRRLANIAAGVRAFDVGLSAVARFPDALYLEPDIVEAFPGYPPYGEPSYRPQDVVPHLTIAIGDGNAFEALAAGMRGHLPFVRRARFLTVVAEGPDGWWRVRWRIPLGRAASG